MLTGSGIFPLHTFSFLNSFVQIHFGIQGYSYTHPFVHRLCDRLIAWVTAIVWYGLIQATSIPASKSNLPLLRRWASPFPSYSEEIKIRQRIVVVQQRNRLEYRKGLICGQEYIHFTGYQITLMSHRKLDVVTHEDQGWGYISEKALAKLLLMIGDLNRIHCIQLGFYETFVFMLILYTRQCQPKPMNNQQCKSPKDRSDRN